MVHLTFRSACKLLGPEGEMLLRRGGQYEIDRDAQITLREGIFRVLTGKSVVEITPGADARETLRIRCSTCTTSCEHQGAALSVILVDKLSLGLSAPPPVRVPVESLSAEGLVQQAIADRQERARTEKMELNSLDPETL